MPGPITTNAQTLWIESFKQNLELSTRQLNSILSPLVMHKDGVTGEQAAIMDFIGKFPLRVATPGQIRDTYLNDITRDRRWADPTTKNGAIAVDNLDVIRSAVNPTSQVVQAGKAAIEEFTDEVIRDAYFGSAKTGKTGATLVPFPAANTIALGGAFSTEYFDVGIAKFETADVDFLKEEISAVISPLQYQQLLADPKFVNYDYTGQRVLDKKTVGNYRGINIYLYNKLPVTGTTRKGMFFAKSGMALAIWEGLKARIDELPTMDYATQIWVEKTLGATRLEEVKTLAFENDESVAP